MSNQYFHILTGSSGAIPGVLLELFTPVPIAVSAVAALLLPFSLYFAVEYLPKRLWKRGQWPMTSGDWTQGTGSDHPIDSAWSCLSFVDTFKLWSEGVYDAEESTALSAGAAA